MYKFTENFIGYFFIIHYISNVLGTLLFHLQHSVNKPYRKTGHEWDPDIAALQGSTYLLFPRIIKFFLLGIEYHHIHHLNTKVPCYNLEICHNDFKDENWLKLDVNFVSFKKMWESIPNVLFDDKSEKLITF